MARKKSKPSFVPKGRTNPMKLGRVRRSTVKPAREQTVKPTEDKLRVVARVKRSMFETRTTTNGHPLSEIRNDFIDLLERLEGDNLRWLLLDKSADHFKLLVNDRTGELFVEFDRAPFLGDKPMRLTLPLKMKVPI